MNPAQGLLKMLNNSEISYYSSEYAQNNYQYTQQLYKKRKDKDFILGNQTIFDISFVYALGWLERNNLKPSRIYEIEGFPLIDYKDEVNEKTFLLIVPCLEGSLMQGIKCKVFRTNIMLEDILDKTITFMKAKNAKLNMMYFDFYRDDDCDKKERIITPFGFMYFNGPQVIPLELKKQ